MSFAQTTVDSVRFEKAQLTRLAWAFLISLIIHGAIIGGYKGGQAAWKWVEQHHPSWLAPLKAVLPLVKKEQPAPKPQPLSDPPLMFVDVNPAVATQEPPPNANFESDKNSLAANPEVDKETGIPKITGMQTDVPKAQDVPRQEDKARNLVPVLPAPTAAEERPAEQAKRTLAPGDMQVGKPDPTPKLDTGNAPKPRPRTLAEAKKQQPADNRVPGVAMKQEGGVKRRLEMAAFDVKATLFGAYESTLVAAISQRWWDLLDERNWAADNRGKVVVKFSLHADGTITGVKIHENTTGAEVLGYVCVKAIQDPAPYSPWPTDLRHEVSSGVIEVQFTFFY